MSGIAGRRSENEGRRGSRIDFEEGGRYLGIPQNGRLAARRDEAGAPTTHNHVLLSVQETGCGTPATNAATFSLYQSWSCPRLDRSLGRRRLQSLAIVLRPPAFARMQKGLGGGGAVSTSPR